MDQVPRLDMGIKDGSLAVEIDKIHGLDPILHHGKKDVKISKFQVSLAPCRPSNIEQRKTVDSLEKRLLEVERNERTRSIDLRGKLYCWIVFGLFDCCDLFRYCQNVVELSVPNYGSCDARLSAIPGGNVEANGGARPKSGAGTHWLGPEMRKDGKACLQVQVTSCFYCA